MTEPPPYNPRPFLLTAFGAAALVLVGFGAVAASQLRPIPRRFAVPTPSASIAGERVVAASTSQASAPAPTPPAVVQAKPRPHGPRPRPGTQAPTRPDCLHSNDPACGLDF